MNAIIRSLRFKGYKKYDQWVNIDFETNINKYQNKEYVKTFKYDENTEIQYNAIIGLIGANTSGKTTILELFEKYATFVTSGTSPFAIRERINPWEHKFGPHGGFDGRRQVMNDPRFQNRSDPRNRGEEPNVFPSAQKIREMQSKIQGFFGDNNFFNANCETLDIQVEILVTGMQITHELCFYRDGTYTENVYIKKRVNKNETRQQVFRKEPEKELSFKTFASLLGSQEITLSAKISNIDSSDIMVACDAIHQIAHSISFVKNEISTPLLKISMNPYFDDPESEEDMTHRIDTLAKIVKVIDPNIIDVRINNLFNRQFTEFEYQTENGTWVKENALSTGTIKFVNVILGGIAINRFLGDANQYILIDEIDNSWHPNLTRVFIRLFKLPNFKNFNLICTFHNPYVAQEFREDALYVLPKNKIITTWVQYINDYNKENSSAKLRLEHSFAKKYLDEIVCDGPSDLDIDMLIEVTKDEK